MPPPLPLPLLLPLLLLLLLPPAGAVQQSWGWPQWLGGSAGRTTSNTQPLIIEVRMGAAESCVAGQAIHGAYDEVLHALGTASLNGATRLAKIGTLFPPLPPCPGEGLRPMFKQFIIRPRRLKHILGFL